LKVVVLLRRRHKLDLMLVFSRAARFESLVGLVQRLLMILILSNLSHTKRIVLLNIFHRCLISFIPMTLWGNVFLNIRATIKNHSLHVPSFSGGNMRAGSI